MNRDVIIANLSDTHSGGLTALFPDYPMSFVYDNKNVLNYSPSLEQKEIYNHWLKCADTLKEMSKKKRKIIVMNGDAIEGNHHGTIQLVTPRPDHQMQIFNELFETFLTRSGYSIKNGDELYIGQGTETHTSWMEHDIKEYFNPYNAQYFDELKLNINGKNLWWAHHGAQPGKGTNEGNALRNYARDTYWDCIKQHETPPDMMTFSHFHKASYDSYNNSYDHTLHIQVLPSWQMKTRHGYKVASMQRNDIGMQFTEVRSDGQLNIQKPFLLTPE